MSEFKELIKSFAGSREYVRDFFVYGFKTRDEFTKKSARTYDNERRRIESWLSGYTQSDFTPKGKNLSLAIDSNSLDTNPLYRVWKTKSFTDNDIMLHFYILDYLRECNSSIPQTIETITDGVLNRYGVLFENQAIRRKCNEYENEGILGKKKQGKCVTYNLMPEFTLMLSEYPALAEAIKFYQLVSPLGILGSTILDNMMETNEIYHVKHSFFVHTLEDEVLLDILGSINNKQNIKLHIVSSKNDYEQDILCTPLQIFVSTRTGRRYLCVFKKSTNRFFNIRLDTIKSVEAMKSCDDFDLIYEQLNNNRDKVWGVSFQSDSRQHIDTIRLTLDIDERYEQFIVERLRREGKGGIVNRIADNTYTYTNSVFDLNEMKPWIRSFIGRIIDVWSDNEKVVKTLLDDMNAMYKMYDIDTSANNNTER